MAYRYRRSRGISSRETAAAAAVGLVLAGLAGAHAHAQAPPTPAHTSHAAAKAIAYARAQEGCPYVYGATGPCSAGFDCSALVMQAWAAAGVNIPRTSEEQWADLPHVSTPHPGDLVFAPGSPIDPPPGHVGMYIGHGQVIEAFASGVPIEQVPLSNFAATSGGITGYAEVR